MDDSFFPLDAAPCPERGEVPKGGQGKVWGAGVFKEGKAEGEVGSGE